MEQIHAGCGTLAASECLELDASLHVVNKDLHIRHLNLPHTHQTYMSGFSTKSPIFWCLNEVYTIDITGARRELISRILSIITGFVVMTYCVILLTTNPRSRALIDQ